MWSSGEDSWKSVLSTVWALVIKLIYKGLKKQYQGVTPTHHVFNSNSPHNRATHNCRTAKDWRDLLTAILELGFLSW